MHELQGTWGSLNKRLCSKDMYHLVNNSVRLDSLENSPFSLYSPHANKYPYKFICILKVSHPTFLSMQGMYCYPGPSHNPKKKDVSSMCGLKVVAFGNKD